MTTFMSRLIVEPHDLQCLGRNDLTFRHGSIRKFTASVSELPKRLLDLANRDAEDTDLIKLVETDQIEMDGVRSPRGIKYAALSYCWGSGVAFKTTPGNLDKHLTADLKVSDMPRTLSDAVRVARDLNIQYLWIDALCILQYQESDPKALQVEAQNDWTHESVRMHAIYGNAWVTIVAAGAAQCDEGLYMIDPHISKLGDQPIFSRAWTLQEWLVSKRLLVFATEAVYYACSKSTPDPDKLGRSDCLRVTLEQLKLRASPVTSDDASYKHDDWLRIIVNFSCRVLSSRPDKLPALSGVAQKIFSDMGLSNADYLAGLCRGKTLIKDLTWAVYRLDLEIFSRNLGQRLGRLNMFMFREKNRRSTSFKASRAPGRAPSWSWASMDGVEEFGMSARTQDLATVLSCETRPAEEGNYFGAELRVWANRLSVATVGRKRHTLYTPGGRPFGAVPVGIIQGWK
ncbi:hypothetical protein G7054_g6351 [Neopestalotiopsis clavispora]|nr:hypothetical protein G7054_g6351 [Neopestalotiopsis clavispora]